MQHDNHRAWFTVSDQPPPFSHHEISLSLARCAGASRSGAVCPKAKWLQLNLTVAKMSWSSSTDWNTTANTPSPFWNRQIRRRSRTHRPAVFCINGVPPTRRSSIKSTAWNWCRVQRVWAAFRSIKVWALDAVRWVSVAAIHRHTIDSIRSNAHLDNGRMRSQR